MKVSTRPSDGAAIVSISGEVDMSTSPDLRRELQNLTRGSVPRIVVDLSDVGFMDSSGIGWLLRCHKRFQTNDGRLIIHSAPDNVLRIFRLLHLSDAIETAESEQDARASVEERKRA